MVNNTNARVLVTRPSGQATNLVGMLKSDGKEPIEMPCIAIRAMPQNAAHRLAMHHEVAIFTSSNAVRHAGQLIGPELRNGTIATLAIGPATCKALESFGIEVAERPLEPYNSESLLHLKTVKSQNLQNVAIVKGKGGRDLLQVQLEARGCTVSIFDVYERFLPKIKDEQLKTVFLNSPVDIVTITSNEMLQNLVHLAGKRYHDALVNLPLVVSSQRAADLAEDLGFRNHVVVASAPGDRGLLDAINIGLDLKAV